MEEYNMCVCVAVISCALFTPGGLIEPHVIPRFLNALAEAGADAHRVDSYITKIGSSAKECQVEKELLMSGAIDAIIFSSTAEVCAYNKGGKWLDVFAI